jgi:hypothetical protein
MAEVTTGSGLPITQLQAAATAEKSKIVAFIKAHYSKLVSALVGYGVAKLGLFAFIWRIL